MKQNYTRQHFELVAAVIASIANADTRKVLSTVWALKLAKTNEKFNSTRFVDACGVASPKGLATTPPIELGKVLHKAGQTLAEANYKNYC